MLKWLIKIGLLLIPAICFAQKDTTTSTTKLSFKKYYIPTGIRVGTDLISLVRNRYDDSFSGWEANVDVDLYRYYLTVDYGHWARSYPHAENNMTYSNDGNYFRIGADVNFLTNDPQRNMFFLGARYGQSKFSETFHLVDSLPNGTVYVNDYFNRNVPAHWLELTTGIRVKIWKFIWLGYTARFKFALKTDNSLDMLPHDVPGFGSTEKDSYWGFNYQIFFRIPVRDYPTLPPKKKKKK